MHKTITCGIPLFVLVFLLGCDGDVTVPTNPARNSALKDIRPITTQAGDWPWWRGPTHDGIAATQSVPHRWSEDENILWKVAVPGKGHASPIVVEDRVFLPTANDENNTMSLLCYDRASGTLHWKKEIHRGPCPSGSARSLQVPRRSRRPDRF